MVYGGWIARAPYGPTANKSCLKNVVKVAKRGILSRDKPVGVDPDGESRLVYRVSYRTNCEGSTVMRFNPGYRTRRKGSHMTIDLVSLQSRDGARRVFAGPGSQSITKREAP